MIPQPPPTQDNLNLRMANNPYKDIAIAIISHFNQAGAEANPFEKLVVGYMFRHRVTTWSLGDGAFLEPQPNYGFWSGCMCDDALGVMKWTDPCCDEPFFPWNEARAAGPGGTLTIEQLFSRLSRGSNLSGTLSAAVTKFQRQMAGINTDLANSYAFYNQMVDVYFEYVNVLDFFFFDYYGGYFAENAMGLLGGKIRDDFNYTGIDTKTVSDGTPAVPGTRGETTIKVNSTDITIDGLYWTQYTSLTTRDVNWLNAGGGVAPIVVPDPGVVDRLIEVAINPLATPDVVAGEIVTAFGGITGYASVIQTVFDTVTFTIATGGLLPASDFTGLVGGTSDWVGGETPGIDPIPGTDEVSVINYNNAIPQNLIGQWFMMYSGGESHMFYIEETANPLDPSTLKNVPAFNFSHAVSMDICNTKYKQCPPKMTCVVGECLQLSKYMQDEIDAVITSVGLWTKVSDADYITTWSTDLEGDTADIDGGTANIGGAYVPANLIGPDGTDWGPVENDNEYQYVWNTSVVAHQASIGEPVPYFKALSSGAPCTPENCGKSTGSFMAQTASPSVSYLLKFNTPGRSGTAKTGRARIETAYW